MIFQGSFFVLCYSILIGLTTATSPIVERSPLLLPAIRSSYSSSNLERRSISNRTTSLLDTSWNGATLINIAVENVQIGQTSLGVSAKIVCTTCYIKGTAIAQITVDGEFNIAQAFKNVTKEIGDDVKNLTDSTVDAVVKYFKTLAADVKSLDLPQLIDDFDFPSINTSFNDVSIPNIPQAQIDLQFDGLELYLELDTSISGDVTYTIPLFRPKTPLGVSIGSEFIGLVFSVDLVLTAKVPAPVNITTGLHIKLNDGIKANIHMFDKNVSSITMNGGKFEFLPVEITTGSVVFIAVLRLGLKVGLEIDSSNTPLLVTASTGIEAGVFFHIAEFSTNITAPANPPSGCKLMAEEAYVLALGADAGATLAIGGHAWGPVATTSTHIFETTMASTCITSKTSTTPVITARAADPTGYKTTTITKSDVYSDVSCKSVGLVNCPASLQTTHKHTVTSTLITSVPSGVKATFPATTGTSVSVIPFGNNIKDLQSTTGVPKNFVPTATSKVDAVLDGKTGGVSNKLIIGVSVGVGVPLLIAVIAGSIWCCKRKRNTPRYAHQNGEITYTGGQSPPKPFTFSSVDFGKKSGVVVTERPRY